MRSPSGRHRNAGSHMDNDPLVQVHARALLTSRPEGACAYIDADVRDPGMVLDVAAATLDFSQPVALMMLGILGHVGDDDQARSIVGEPTGALTPGSYLTLSDGANTSQHQLGRAHLLHQLARSRLRQ